MYFDNCSTVKSGSMRFYSVTKKSLVFLFIHYFMIVNGQLMMTKPVDLSMRKGVKKPNIMFILTDDQDVFLGGMDPMTKVKQLLQDEGTTFTNMFTTTPLCCPSRASILTGRYSHNHATVNNSISGNCSSPYWQKHAELNSMAVLVKKAGYRNYFAGKYLNQYGKKISGGAAHIPPGWDDWFALMGNSRYYNYTVSDNGKAVDHGDNYEKDYLTDLLKNRTIRNLKEHKLFRSPQPFFMMVSTPAPHSPWDVAPGYEKQFANKTAPQTPSYNKLGKDKHWLLRQATNPMTADSITYLNDAFRKRWRTLLSVDDLVGDVISTLRDEQLLDNTYVIYSSDNGYHLGQFSLPIDKRQLYEFDVRVPLVVRGPGVTRNSTRAQPVLNIDLAPTIVHLATAAADHNSVDAMDGASLVPLFNVSNTPKWRSDLLVEYQGEGKESQPGCPTKGAGVSQCFPDCVCEDSYNNTYSCVRTIDASKQKNIMYCEFTDKETFVEVYDLVKDQDQLTNIKSTVDPQLLVEMNQRLIELGVCAGKTCRTSARDDDDDVLFIS